MKLNHLAVFTFIAFLTAACGDDDNGQPTPGNPNPVYDTGQPRQIPDAGPQVTGPNKLTHATQTDNLGQPCVQSCTLIVKPGTPLGLNVFYRNAAGQPLPGQMVQFTTTANPNIAKLQASTATVNPQGLAGVQLLSFANSTGEVFVTATVTSDPQAGSLSFKVIFAADQKSPLTVNFQYKGTNAASTFKANFYLQNNNIPLCADVHPSSLNQYQPVVTEGPVAQNQQFKPQLPGLIDAGVQYWTVQVVGPADAANPTAVGCQQGVEVKQGEERQITIEVNDMPLSFGGNYDVFSFVDMYSGMSGTAGTIIGVIVGIFDDPGKVFIKAACENASGIVFGGICNILVDSNDNLTAAGIAASDAAKEVFLKLISDQLGPNVAFTGESLAKIFTDMRFRSRMSLIQEPTEPGLHGSGSSWKDGTANESWEFASFKWTVNQNCDPNDPNACLVNVKLKDVYGIDLKANIKASVDEQSRFYIEKHEVPGFTYGKLMSFILEKKLLPLIFGAGINSYLKLIASVFGGNDCQNDADPVSACCAVFAQKPAVIDQIGTTFAKPGCQLLIPAAANWIGDRINSLSGSLQIGTFKEQPCNTLDLTKNLKVDSMGSLQQKCTWDATWPLSGTDFNPKANWYSTATSK